MKKHISKSAMVLSAMLLFGASSAPSLDAVFAEDTVDEVSESIESTVDDSANDINESVTVEETESTSETHNEMEHDDEGRLPGNIKIEREPTYKVGDSVEINATHMPGMEGSEGRIVAAFDTTAYEISYTPTDGSEPVENHRWIVQEEITEAEGQENDAPFEVGDEVTVEAYHMPGMEGATATIDAANETTVYLVDYIDTETGEEVINHKWVTEDELAALDAAEENAPTESAEESQGSDESSADGSSESEPESESDESSNEESESSEEETSEESTPEESTPEESESEETAE